MKGWIFPLLLFVAALAQPYFDSFSITTDIGLSYVYEEMRIKIVNAGSEPLTNFSYSLGYDPGEVYSEINKVKTKPKMIIEDGTWIMEFDFEKPVKLGESVELMTRFRADPLVTVSDTREFRFRFSPQYLARTFSMQVLLPAGGVLAERKIATQTLPVVFPEAAVSTNGRRISVEWTDKNVNSEKVYLMTFELPIKPVQTQNLLPFLVPIPFIFLVFIALYSTDLRWKSTIEALDEHDKLVLNEVRKKRGISAKEIVAKTGLSKVKIFRVTQRLGSRNLIKIEKYANRTRIYLSEKLEGVLNPINSIKQFFSNLIPNLPPKP